MRNRHRLHRLFTILLFNAFCAGTRVAYGHGSYHDVVDQINRELENTPDDAALRFRLARAHQEHGDWTAALVEVERVDRLAPDKYETALVQGQALAEGGHWLAAKASLDRFIHTHADHSLALAQRARVLIKLEQISAALRDYRAALAKTANAEPGLFTEAADALAMHGALDEAVEVLRRGIGQCGHVPSLLLRSLDYEMAAKHFDEALERVAALQKAAPRPEPWLARRAQILDQARRTAEAKAAWTSLRDHLLSLPNLERGTASMSQLFAAAQQALGTAAPAAVVAPPASASPSAPSTSAPLTSP